MNGWKFYFYISLLFGAYSLDKQRFVWYNVIYQDRSLKKRV